MRGLNARAVSISAPELRGLLGDSQLILIDARRRNEYLEGHVPGALSVPIGEVVEAKDPDALVKIFTDRGIGDESLVVVYDDNFGVYAARVAWSLEFLGHPRVRILDATYSTWRVLGYEVVVDEPPKVQGMVNPKLNTEILATAEYVGQMVERRGGHLIDVRERLNFLEAHIPGAHTMPWQMFTGRNGRVLRDPEDVRRLLQRRGISLTDEVVTYCGGAGTLSGLAFYVLRLAGLSKVRLYANSFIEWKQLSLPVERVGDSNYWDLSAD